jgi:hypothetical protein
MLGLLRPIRLSVRQSADRSSITAIIMLERSGRARGTGLTGQHPASLAQMSHRQHLATFITPTPMMFPGMRSTAFRRMSYPPQDHTCRIVPRRR